MKNSASIQVDGSAGSMRFRWRGFDGDDCFASFSIEVKQKTTTKRFNFGRCAVYGLRKLSKFFRDTNELSVSGGFENPAPCYYDLVRNGGSYRLSVRFEGTGISEEFQLRGDSVQIDDEFLSEY